MYNSTPIDTVVEKGLTLSINYCPKNRWWNRDNEQCPL